MWRADNNRPINHCLVPLIDESTILTTSAQRPPNKLVKPVLHDQTALKRRWSQTAGADVCLLPWLWFCYFCTEAYARSSTHVHTSARLFLPVNNWWGDMRMIYSLAAWFWCKHLIYCDLKQPVNWHRTPRWWREISGTIWRVHGVRALFSVYRVRSDIFARDYTEDETVH